VGKSKKKKKKKKYLIADAAQLSSDWAGNVRVAGAGYPEAWVTDRLDAI
jgi:hypothetical protein